MCPGIFFGEKGGPTWGVPKPRGGVSPQFVGEHPVGCQTQKPGGPLEGGGYFSAHNVGRNFLDHLNGVEENAATHAGATRDKQESISGKPSGREAGRRLEAPKTREVA